MGERKSGERKMGDRPHGERKVGDRPHGERKVGERKMGERKAGERSFGAKPGFRGDKASAPQAKQGNSNNWMKNIGRGNTP